MAKNTLSQYNSILIERHFSMHFPIEPAQPTRRKESQESGNKFSQVYNTELYYILYVL